MQSSTERGATQLSLRLGPSDRPVNLEECSFEATDMNPEQFEIVTVTQCLRNGVLVNVKYYFTSPIKRPVVGIRKN